MSDEQPEAEAEEGTEAEGAKEVLPPLADDPIGGDQRTDVLTVGGGDPSDPQPESQPRPLAKPAAAPEPEAEA